MQMTDRIMVGLSIRSVAAVCAMMTAAVCVADTAEVDNPLDNSLIYTLGLRGDLNGDGNLDADEITNGMDPSSSGTIAISSVPNDGDTVVFFLQFSANLRTEKFNILFSKSFSLLLFLRS